MMMMMMMMMMMNIIIMMLQNQNNAQNMRKFEQKSERRRSATVEPVDSFPSRGGGSYASCTALICYGRACLEVGLQVSIIRTLF